MVKKKNIVFAVLWYALIVIIAVALIVGNVIAMDFRSIISTTLGHDESKLVQLESDEKVDSQYFKSKHGYTNDDAGKEKLRKDGRALCEEIESEGMVLLMNKDGGLPLGTGKRVSLFGMTSVNPVYGGTGSGSIDTTLATKPVDAFRNVGYEVNPTLDGFYNSFLKYGANGKLDTKNSKYIRTSASIEGNATVDYCVNECPQHEYTAAVKDSYKDYKDAAIVFIGRSGGEGSDLSMTNSESGAKGYLALSKNEADMLQAVQDSADFDKIFVIVNSSNAMELEWLNDYSKIKACLWVGSVGTTGLDAVAGAFTGKYNPSGRLVDTYAADSHSAPASANFGYLQFTNAKESGLEDINEAYMGSARQWTAMNYVTYLEGIYVGYRYYETRYEDTVLKAGNANGSAGVYKSTSGWNYAQEVTYPFGYGLSYTTFEYGDYNVVPRGDDYEVTVTVTNTGSVKGKHVVQVYMQSPYTDYDRQNEIEKASIELVGFAKTDVIEPNKSETVKIVVDEEELRTYDAKNAKTYIRDGGRYYFTVGSDAHDAINNVLAAKGKTKADGMDADGNAALVKSFDLKQDLKRFSSDKSKIENQFDEADVHTYYPDLKYLTRSDWQGTYPTTAILAATDKLAAALKKSGAEYVKEPDRSKYSMPVTGAKNDLQLITLRGADYDDGYWDKLLDQMTVDEMLSLVALGGWKTQPVESITYKGTTDKDGPQGISGTLVSSAGEYKCMAYTSEVVLASTYNEELVERVGQMIGEDGLMAGIVGWYGPAMNTHRTPFVGRSFEYFSEDGFVGGKIAAAEVRGARSMGMYTYCKHFALNDQDTNRKGLATFANEQSIREIYLTPFEFAVKEGKSNAIMTSHNRIGTEWAAADEGLNIKVLRDEWGFVGHVITDYAGTLNYQYTAHAVMGRNFMLASAAKAKSNLEPYKDDPYVMSQVRDICHDILYSGVNSAAMNGVDQNTRVVKIMPLWMSWLITLDVVVGLLLLAGAGLTTWLCFFKRAES